MIYSILFLPKLSKNPQFSVIFAQFYFYKKEKQEVYKYIQSNNLTNCHKHHE